LAGDFSSYLREKPVMTEVCTARAFLFKRVECGNHYSFKIFFILKYIKIIFFIFKKLFLILVDKKHKKYINLK
jgi:hypothetical protein